MISIAIMNIKGGIGKTTSVVNIAACFSQLKHKRVLVIDCDLQANATSYLLMNQYLDEDGVQHLPRLAMISDFLDDKPLEPTKVVFEKNTKKKKDDNCVELGLIGSEVNVALLPIDDIHTIADKLKTIDDDYDYCFFDCPAELSNLALAAIYASDYVLVPSHPDSDSLKGYSIFVEAVNKIRTSTDNNRVKILGVFFNQVYTNDSLQAFIIKDLRENMGDELMDTTIRSAATVRQCRYFGFPVCFYKPRTMVAKDYKELTEELFKRMGTE